MENFQRPRKKKHIKRDSSSSSQPQASGTPAVMQGKGLGNRKRRRVDDLPKKPEPSSKLFSLFQSVKKRQVTMPVKDAVTKKSKVSGKTQAHKSDSKDKGQQHTSGPLSSHDRSCNMASKHQPPSKKKGKGNPMLSPPASRKDRPSMAGMKQPHQQMKQQQKQNNKGKSFSTSPNAAKEDTSADNAKNKFQMSKGKGKSSFKDSHTSNGSTKHPFTVENGDHAETSSEAYNDILPILDLLAKKLGKSRATLKLYDPYYCDGSVVHRLNALGFKNVYNKCEDFYVKIEADEIPEHDILITNPPYSGDHMERIIRFCSKTNKPVPWLVLMPHFVYTKKYYDDSLNSQIPFCVIPRKRYFYFPPSWTEQEARAHQKNKGKWTSPFPSFWYCHGGTAELTNSIRKSFTPWKYHGSTFASTVEDLPQYMKAELENKKKRLNPKARKRLAKKRKAGLM